MDAATRAYIETLVDNAPEPDDHQVAVFARLFTATDTPVSDAA